MFSLNKWVVKGKIVDVTQNSKGSWVTVNGIAKNPDLFVYDSLLIRCWIPKRILVNTTLEKELSVKGSLQFKKKDCYLVADSIL